MSEDAQVYPLPKSFCSNDVKEKAKHKAGKFYSVFKMIKCVIKLCPSRDDEIKDCYNKRINR